MKKILNLLVMSVLLTVAFTSCDDDEPSFDKKPFANTELLSILKTKGFTVEAGMLVIDNKVSETKTLDLSGTKLADFTGLELFPNLTELNLSNNDYNITFDFAKLPANIKSVDLSNNNLFEFKGLATVDVANANVTVNRNFDKMVLPNTAKYNVETLPFYFKKNGCTDMQMQNKDGKAEKYTTLREIPDATIREYLKKALPSKFEGDKLDIYKKFSLDESKNTLSFNTVGGLGTKITLEKAPTTIDGIQYIINDPRWEGIFTSKFKKERGENFNWGTKKSAFEKGASYTLDYIKIGEKVRKLNIKNISTNILDFSNAKSLYGINIEENETIQKIDLSNTALFTKGEDNQSGAGDFLILGGCPNLEELILPNMTNSTVKPFALTSFELFDLPKLKLKKVDLSKIEFFRVTLVFVNVPNDFEVVYPVNLDYSFLKERSSVELGLDENMKNKKSTQEFIKKFNFKKNRISNTLMRFGDKTIGYRKKVGTW